MASRSEPALAAVSAYLAYVHADNADPVQSVLDVVQFFLANDGFDLFGHLIPPSRARRAQA